MNLPPIFQHCVGTSLLSRYEMERPWREGDMVYATNGWAIVRCKYRPEFGDVPTNDNPPPHAGLWMAATEFAADPLPIPELPTPLQPTTITSTECPDCEGDGTSECPHCGEQSVDCKKCDGTGEVKPYDITTGPPRELIAWDQICLNASIVRCLRECGASIYPPKRRGKPARFVCPDGSDGLVMPHQPPKDAFDAKRRDVAIVVDLRQ